MEKRPPQQRRATPRPNLRVGDIAALVEAGRMDPPQQPRERPVPAPPQGGGPSPAEAAHRLMLDDALVDAGVTQGASDTAAVAAAARLDSATVATIARWIRRGRAAEPPAPR